MKPCQCIRGKTGQRFIDILSDLSISVIFAQSFVVILFDIIVVAVTLTSTLGTWRLYQRSTWETMSLTHLLAQQSEWYLPFHLNSDDRNCRSDENWVFIHLSLVNKYGWLWSDSSWQCLLLPQSSIWYCHFKFYGFLLLTRCTRLWEWVDFLPSEPQPFTVRLSRPSKGFLGLCITSES